MNKKLFIRLLLILSMTLVILGGYFLLFANKEEKIKILPNRLRTVEDTEAFRIVTNVEPPTSYYSMDGKFIGTTVDIVEEIKRYLNLDTKIEVMPWARSYFIAKENPNVVIFTAAKTQERENLGFNFIGPVMTRKHLLWAKKGSGFSIGNIQDIKDQNLQLGAMRGDWREKYFLDLGLNVDNVADHRQNLEKLLEGRIDLWVSSDIEAPLIAKEVGVSMGEIEVAYIFQEASSYIMLSKDTPEETVKGWEEAYEEIQKTDFFENASRKWSNVLESQVRYAKDTGFFIR